MINRGSTRFSIVKENAKSNADLAFQLIDSFGNFKSQALNDFANEINLSEYGHSYAVVAIIGPLCSGKSTLLNHLFKTKFKEMDPYEERSETTKGIWLARCPNINPLTLVMDTEGSDENEIGEVGFTIQRCFADFFLAVADVVLVNMWFHDIGREHAASKPILKVVFEQALFRFSNKPRKITLMFVVRDRTRIIEQKLESRLRSDVEKIWASIKKKPTERSNGPISDFFKIEAVFLPNYEVREAEFKSKVRELKQRFVRSTAPGGIADSGEKKEPGSGFAISAQNIWQDIQKNKDRNSFPESSGDADLAFQLINEDSNFNSTGLNDFTAKVNLHECGRSYAVVAIIGAQSGGKSTLLNHLFQTKFKEMDEYEGRSQSTHGIWLARCPNLKPLTLVMDTEGSDGCERGEDETSFERRVALFVLAVADVVLVNLWCHDIGREHAASKPLLKVVFQQALFRFSNKPRKITLMFVVRDKTKSPEQKLEARLMCDVEKIWASIKKPTESSNAPFSDFFKVEIVFLPNYELKEDEFILKVKELKQRFVDSTAPGGLADSGEGKELASGFANRTKNIWEDIVENKDLNLPPNKVLVATIRCQQISTELLDSFETNKDWCNLRKEAFNGFVPDFGRRVDSILHHFLSRFDAEASYFDNEVTIGKRKELVDDLLKLVQPVYQAVLDHLRLLHLKKFMEAFEGSSDGMNEATMVTLLGFDKDCEAIKIDLANWDTFKARAKLQQDMKTYITAQGEIKIAAIIRRLYEPQVKHELSDYVGDLLCKEADPTWFKIRRHLNSVMQSTKNKLNTTLLEFGIGPEGRREKIQHIQEYAKKTVETKAREESGRVREHMMRKFHVLFKIDLPWKSEQEFRPAAKAAIYTPMDILSGLAAIRLEAGDTDNIHQMLSSAFGDSGNPVTIRRMSSSSWAEVPSARTLLTPSQCIWFWTAYIIEANDVIKQAYVDLKKNKPSSIISVLNVLKEITYAPLNAVDWVFMNLL